MNKGYTYTVVFFVAIAAMSVLYDYPSELFRHPHGYHIWRQCDGASIALNYYNVSMNFFEPRLSIITGNDGKMVSEFPIVYYMAACLYKVFGFHEFFIRLITALISLFGLYYLYKTVSLMLGDKWYGLVLSLMLFTSPVVIDYGLNFLPDVPALSLTFAGFYSFAVYLQSKNTRSLYKGAFFFSLAGLLKVTALIFFLGLTGTIALVGFFSLLKREMPYWWNHKIALGAFVLIPLIVTFSWVAFAKHYNTSNDNFYFTTDIRPIWKVDAIKTSKIWDEFKYQWLRMTMYRDFLNTVPFLALGVLVFYSRKNWPYTVWMLLCIVGSMAYLLLFFEQFIVHDYYMICIAALPIVVLFCLLNRIKEWRVGVFNSIYLKIALTVLLGVMIHHGYRMNIMRESLDYHSYHEYSQLDETLERAGIVKTDKVISMGDESTGITLYLMNRRGWTQYGMNNPVTNSNIESCIQKGAKYILVYEKSDVPPLSDEVKTTYLQNSVFEFPGVKVYSLQ